MTEPGEQPAYCKYCNAPITWGLTVAGKSMPFDTKTSGKVWVYSQRSRRYHNVSSFVPHWATCPKADQARNDAAKKREAQSG